MLALVSCTAVTVRRMHQLRLVHTSSISDIFITLLVTGVHGRKWMLGRLKNIDSTADTLQRPHMTFTHLLQRQLLMQPAVSDVSWRTCTALLLPLLLLLLLLLLGPVQSTETMRSDGAPHLASTALPISMSVNWTEGENTPPLAGP